ncbi:pirin family protein [Pontibacter liquoris]|uniref:pirin family protein n=1 Tax=Pontibacter liquoris TaxID=2905677 RepID=UPI001FA6C3B0|nr:pirin family protein [Pontibacter liquoris]
MKNRTVERLLYAEITDMGDMPVRQPFPTQQVGQLDPFLLLHHHIAELPEDAIPGKAGVGPHPHRGFSAVTFVYRGGVHHRDSRGNNSVVYAGGTQWLHAGMGLVHSERPPHDLQEHGGVQEIVQLWINSPAAHKMDQPSYQALQAEDTPVVESEDRKVRVQVVAGTYQVATGPIKPVSPVLALRLTMKATGVCQVPLPENFNAFLYLLDGSIRLEGYGLVEGHYAVMLHRDGEGVTLTATEDTRVLLMAAAPLDEPVASHGPFVMNNQTQLMQAMRDYQMGKMGILIED